MDNKKSFKQEFDEYIGCLKAERDYSSIRESIMYDNIIEQSNKLWKIFEEDSKNEIKNETIINNLREFIEILDNQIDLLYENLPTSKEEFIQKNATAFAYQKVLWTLENILQGKRYNEE